MFALRLGRAVVATAACLLLSFTVSARAQRVRYSSAHRDGERVVPQTISGGTARLRAALSASRTPLSVVSADFDEDGVSDLVAGYTSAAGGALLLQRGNPRATAPTPAEWALTAAGELVVPYVAKSEVIALPVSPSLLATADLSGHGHPDLLAASKGDSVVYFLRGRGDGSFSAPQAIALSGSVSALTLWRAPSGDNLLVAGVCGASGCGLQFVDRDGVTRSFVATPGIVTAIQTGVINNGYHPDFALIAGNRVLVLDGDTALQVDPTLETLPVTGASAIALGTFVPDHRPGLQIAVLGTDATLHVITRAGIDASYDPARRRTQNLERAQLLLNGVTSRVSTPHVKNTGLPWTEAETVSNVGPGGAAMMLRARLTGGGNDDLAVMAGSQYVTVAHPLEREGGLFKTSPVVTLDSTSSPVTAAVAARVNADARVGVVTLGGGVHPLTVAVPTAYRTMTVSTTADGTPTAASRALCTSGEAGCTLRSAITQANLDRSHNGISEVDTINILAGTYVLSAVNTNSSGQTQNPDYLGSVNYHLELDASMNLVGVGSGSTIINANGIDQVMAIDYGSFYAASEDDFESVPEDVFLTSMTIENGKNPNNPGLPSSASESAGCRESGGAGYCNNFGGNLQWTVEGASNLVLTSVVVSGGISPYAGGGGISTFYDTSSTGTAGPLEIDTSTISNNQQTATDSNEGGGGIVIEYETIALPLVLSKDTISGNTAYFEGGGLAVLGDSGTITITGTTFSGNKSTSIIGGGATIVGAPTTISGSTFTGNSAVGFGGGINLNSPGFANTLTANTFTSNTLSGSEAGVTYGADGAGVCVQASETSTATYALHYNRFHGNGASGTTPRSTGLGVGCDNADSTAYAVVNASDNWWGCNPSTATNGTAGTLSGTACDTAGIGNSTDTSTTLTVSPYTTLTLTLSSTTPTANSSFTATGSLAQDSAGTVYSSANDAAYIGVPATIAIRQNSGTASLTNNPSTTLTTVSGPASYAGIQADATATSTGTGSATVTVDSCTISQAGATTNSTPAYACNTNTAYNFTVIAPDLTVTSSHTGNFKAGGTGNTYTLTAGNSGTGPTSGTVTVTDTLPSGFTATAMSGSGWTCTVSSLTCTSSSVVNASVSFPAITLTVSVSSSDIGTYTNSVAVSGGGEINTANDTGTDSTIVVGPATISEGFAPTSVAPNATSTVTFTLGNPSANSVSLAGVAFSDSLPSGLKITTAAATTCSGGTAVGAVGASALSLSGATIAAGATCTVTAGVASTAIGSYTNTTGTVTTSNANAGSTASATLTVAVTPNRLVYTAAPASPVTAGGNAGTVTVALEDGSGNIAANNSSTVVTLAVTSTSGYSQTYTATASNGVAAFNLSSVVLTVSGSYTYTGSATGLASASTTETVNAGSAVALSGAGPTSFSAPAQTGSITVRAVDSYGNTVTSFTGTVTLTSNDALATLPAAYTYTASDAGSHTFTYSFGTAGTARTLTATSGSLTTTQMGIAVNDCILFINPSGTLSRLTDAGVATSPSAGYTGGGAPTVGIAVDSLGDIWSVNTSSNVLAEFSKSGTALSGSGFSGGGLSAPNAVMVDGNGSVWVVNGNNTVSVFTNAGAAVSSIAQPVTGGAGTNAIAIDISGNLWITGSTSNTITEIIGGAAPTPSLAVGVTNATTGTRP